MGRVTARLEEGLLALLLAAMTILTFVQVVLRYIFNHGFVWALEANTYMFGWLIMIGVSYGIRVHSHIGVDFAVKALPRLWQRVAGLLAIAFCLLYAALMLDGAWTYLYKLWRLDLMAEDIPAPRWLLSAILPAGFALLILRLVGQAIDILRGRASGLLLADEAAETLRELHPTPEPPR